MCQYIMQEVRDSYDTMLMHLCSNTLERFKTSLEQSKNVAAINLCSQSCMREFVQGCEDAAIQQSEWNASKFREKLICDMLSEMMAKYEKQITHALAKRVESLLESGERDTWASIRNLFEGNTEAAVSEFSDAAVSFNLNSSEIDTKSQHLREHARNLLEMKAREAADAGRVLRRMKYRFSQVLGDYENSMSWYNWTEEKNLDEVERNALSESLRILSIMAAMRFDEMPDQIEMGLHSSLMDRTVPDPSLLNMFMGATLDPLASDTWEEDGRRRTRRYAAAALAAAIPAAAAAAIAAAVAAAVAAAAAAGAVVAGPAAVLNAGVATFMRVMGLYDREVVYFDQEVRNEKQRQLLSNALMIAPGKSTLLNQLFRTDFTMMDAYEGRGQTTQGIWIGKGIGIEPFTIAMDVEGSDSSERGQDGTTTFEKRSALFALAIADIVIINMWCHDIGREHAASRPLLKTVFEAMTRLFGARKTTLLFVLRDQTPTPLACLENILRRDIDQIWAAAAKTKALGWNLGDYFNVEIIALPNYVALLRQRFIHSISPGGLAGDRKDVQPASGFSLRAEQIWKTIKENKDLDLPALEVMVATFRCDQIAKEKLIRLKLDDTRLAMSKALKSGPVSEFGKKLSSILENYLSQYDMEAMDYEEGIRKDKRQRLETEALQAVYPAYAAMLQHLRSIALKSFKTKLEKTVKEKRGDGFKAFVDSCGRSIMLEFKKGCEDATIKIRVSDWVAGEANFKERLQLEIEKLKSEFKAEGKKIQKEKIKKGVTTSAGVVAGVTAGAAALTLVSDPVTATSTGIG
ncbi:protein ROOT HAIR DEFECTIVE 3, partial [Populus alba x Populus x berolinensis]